MKLCCLSVSGIYCLSQKYFSLILMLWGILLHPPREKMQSEYEFIHLKISLLILLFFHLKTKQSTTDPHTHMHARTHTHSINAGWCFVQTAWAWLSLTTVIISESQSIQQVVVADRETAVCLFKSVLFKGTICDSIFKQYCSPTTLPTIISLPNCFTLGENTVQLLNRSYQSFWCC